jgi:hypothetical protein
MIPCQMLPRLKPCNSQIGIWAETKAMKRDENFTYSNFGFVTSILCWTELGLAGYESVQTPTIEAVYHLHSSERRNPVVLECY